MSKVLGYSFQSSFFQPTYVSFGAFRATYFLCKRCRSVRSAQRGFHSRPFNAIISKIRGDPGSPRGSRGSNDENESNQFEREDLDLDEGLPKVLQQLENNRGVVAKSLRREMMRDIKSMDPNKNPQRIPRKNLKQRGTSTMFLVSPQRHHRAPSRQAHAQLLRTTFHKHRPAGTGEGRQAGIARKS